MLGNPLPVATLVFRDRSFLSPVPAIERGKVEGQRGVPVDTDAFAPVLLNPEPDGGGILLIFENLGVTVETSLQMEVTATLEILDSAMVDGQPLRSGNWVTCCRLVNRLIKTVAVHDQRW